MTTEKKVSGPQTAPPRIYPTSINLRVVIVAVAVAALLFGFSAAAWPLRLAGGGAVVVCALWVFWHDGRRRLELHADKLVLVSASKRREVPFRTVEAWSIPLGTTLELRLREARDQPLKLTRWRKQGDMNAAIVTAIRLAGSTFDKRGAETLVRWSA